MKSDVVTESLYRGMTKKAEGSASLTDWFSNLSPEAKASLVTGVGGAGVGLLTHLLTPKDDDENLTQRMLTHVLTTAALGSLAGYGLSRLGQKAKPYVTPEPPGLYEKYTPEIGWGDLGITAGGIGTYAGGHKLYNKIRSGLGTSWVGRYDPDVVTGMRLLDAATPADIQGSTVMNTANAALSKANTPLRSRLLQKIDLPDKLGGRWLRSTRLGQAAEAARRSQRVLDEDLLRALHSLGTTSGRRGAHPAPFNLTQPQIDALLKGWSTNPRKLMRAAKRARTGGWGKGIMATLSLGGLVGTGLKASGID